MLAEILLKQGYIAIALQQSCVGLLELNASLDGVPLTFILDTGAANTVIDLEFAHQHDMPVHETDEQGGGVGSSQMSIYVLEPEQLVIGDFILDRPAIFAMDFLHVKETLLAKGVTEPAHGVIGADILIPFQAVIDYAGLILYLKSNREQEIKNEKSGM